MTAQRVGGVLLLYRRPISRHFGDASTIDDNIAAFGRHSRYRVHAHNTELGYPRGLDDAEFDAVVLHYSLFGISDGGYAFSPLFERYLDHSESYKIATFHDEHVHCRRRFAFLNDRGIDCVFTCLEPPQFDAVYGAYTEVSKIVSHFPAYVSDSLVEAAGRLTVPDSERTVDVGFRARPFPPYMGIDEKTAIGRGFEERAAASEIAADMVRDIEVSDESLLPGEDWYRFVAGCKTVLGVESGTRCFDLEDEVYEAWLRISEEGGEATVEDLRRNGPLERWEDRVAYRTIGPRNFEAAALRVCQVLFEGSYSGVMEPMRHYIPLRKDFSNFEEVLERIRDPALCEQLAENAYRDLVASGEHTYASFMRSFDAVLDEAGLDPDAAGDPEAADRALRRSPPALAAQRLRSTLSYHPVASKLLWRVSRPPLNAYRRLRRARVERG